MTIKIRPHHIQHLSKKALHYGTPDTYTRSLLSEVYGDESIDHMEEILRRINSGEDVEIVDGEDDICEKCRYFPHCKKGNYEPVTSATNKFFEKYKVNVRQKDNPENADRAYTAHLKLKNGQILSKEDLKKL